MRTTASSVAVLVSALVLPFGGSEGRAQEILSFAPTYEQSVATYEYRFDPVLGAQSFRAWGLMLGVERPGRFWQPHVWFQRYRHGEPCRAPSGVVDCDLDGWALSVGPGLRFLDAPRLSAIFLPQVGLRGRGGGLNGGAGLHVGVKLGAIRPTAFSRIHVSRGASYATVGGGIVFRFPLERD
jgi:hypothetical protein